MANHKAQRVAPAGVAIAVSALLPAGLFAGEASAAGTVTGVRVGEHSGHTRIVLDANGATPITLLPGIDGNTLVAELPGAQWSAPLKKAFPGSRHVSSYDVMQRPDGGYRMIIATKGPVGVLRTLNLTPSEGRGHRVVIDVSASAPVAVAPAPAVMAAAPAPAAVAVQPAKVGLNTPADTRPFATIAPQVSTLGLGAEIGYRINPVFGIRGNFNYFTLSPNLKIDGIDYDASVRLKSMGVLADLHPFENGFHLSGGLRLNMNEAKLSTTPTQSMTIGNAVYTPAQIGKLDGKFDFGLVSPYLGLGWRGTALSPNLFVSADIGVLFQGAPKASLSATGAATNAALQADIERERDTMEDKLEGLRFYPVLSLSAGYRF